MKMFLKSGFITFTLLLSTFSTTLLAQSVINIVATPPTRITDAATGELVGAGFVAATFWAPLGVTAQDDFLQLGAPTAVVNGAFSGGSRTLPAPVGTTVQLFGAAWESIHGASYQQASQVIGARVGRSAVVQANTSSEPVLTTVRIPDFSVTAVVPEPSSIALILLGGGLFLLRRRR